MKSRVPWYVAVWVAALGFAGFALKFPNFWPLFLGPAIAFVLLQHVGLSRWEHKEAFFKFTDYAYYLFIGGFIALGSRFLLQADQVGALNNVLETQVLQQRLRRIDVELPRLRSESEHARSAQESTDADFAAQCMAEQFTRRLTERDLPRKPEIPRIDLCAGYFSSLALATELPMKIASLESERAATSIRLREISSNPDAVNTQARGRDPTRMEIEFLWVPMLLLGGISMKLGKTTSSLWPMSASAA